MWRCGLAHAPRRDSRRIPRRAVRLRHRDRHRRVSRSAPSPPLPEVPPGLLAAISGYDTPALVDGVRRGGTLRVRDAMPRSRPCTGCPRRAAHYLLPFGARSRFLFKMDFAEAEYISRLRSGVKGHFSYREIAWEMKCKMEQLEPELGRLIRGHAALGGRSVEAVRRLSRFVSSSTRFCRQCQFRHSIESASVSSAG